MPLRKNPLERNNDAKETIQQDDPDPTKELLQILKDQMAALAAKNEATNTKLEMFSIQYQNLHGTETNKVVHATPQNLEEPSEPLRSTTLPKENRIVVTLLSGGDHERTTKFPKILYQVFDETGDLNWHIRWFKVLAQTNGILSSSDL